MVLIVVLEAGNVVETSRRIKMIAYFDLKVEPNKTLIRFINLSFSPV